MCNNISICLLRTAANSHANVKYHLHIFNFLHPFAVGRFRQYSSPETKASSDEVAIEASCDGPIEATDGLTIEALLAVGAPSPRNES